jgi:hypothetical protein
MSVALFSKPLVIVLGVLFGATIAMREGADALSLTWLSHPKVRFGLSAARLAFFFYFSHGMSALQQKAGRGPESMFLLMVWMLSLFALGRFILSLQNDWICLRQTKA